MSLCHESLVGIMRYIPGSTLVVLQLHNIYQIDENLDSIVDYEIADPDFSFVQFRSNLVVRWEYIPGSELFFVWSQGVTGNVDSMSSLFEGLKTGIIEQQPENIFLIKATYRFVL